MANRQSLLDDTLLGIYQRARMGLASYSKTYAKDILLDLYRDGLIEAVDFTANIYFGAEHHPIFQIQLTCFGQHKTLRILNQALAAMERKEAQS